MAFGGDKGRSWGRCWSKSSSRMLLKIGTVWSRDRNIGLSLSMLLQSTTSLRRQYQFPPLYTQLQSMESLTLWHITDHIVTEDGAIDGSRDPKDPDATSSWCEGNRWEDRVLGEFAVDFYNGHKSSRWWRLEHSLTGDGLSSWRRIDCVESQCNDISNTTIQAPSLHYSNSNFNGHIHRHRFSWQYMPHQKCPSCEISYGSLDWSFGKYLDGLQQGSIHLLLA